MDLHTIDDPRAAFMLGILSPAQYLAWLTWYRAAFYSHICS